MKRGRHYEKYRPSFGTFCPKGIKSVPCLKTRNIHETHKRQAILVWPHSEIFAGPQARKNACWGTSPNPALWDKISQRDWLCHRRCRSGTLLFSSYWKRHLFMTYFHQVLPTFAFFNSIPIPQRCSNSDFNSSVV